MHMPGSSTLTSGRQDAMMSSNLGSLRKITVMEISMNVPPTSGIISVTLP